LGTPISSSGTYHDTLINSFGCDSIVTLVFTVLPEHSDTVQAQICTGDTFSFNNVAYTVSGNYLATFISANGCDSHKVLQLTVHPIPNAPNVVSPLQYCFGATIAPLTASGTNLLWYTTPSGGVGNAMPPTPFSNVLGRQVYYV